MSHIIIFFFYRSCFILQNPDIAPGIKNIFLSPFANSTWYSLCLISAMFVVALRWCYNSDRLIALIGETDSWSSAILVTFGVLCQQGSFCSTMHLLLYCNRSLHLDVLLTCYRYIHRSQANFWKVIFVFHFDMQRARV